MIHFAATRQSAEVQAVPISEKLSINKVKAHNLKTGMDHNSCSPHGKGIKNKLPSAYSNIIQLPSTRKWWHTIGNKRRSRNGTGIIS
jgi:hypothetical protein